MITPKQATILCGGLGTRLRPITDKIPKPMVLVNGVPFLEHLILQLKENNIFEFVLLTGYRGDLIQEYFGDGKAIGVNIQYSHGPAEWETGRRLYEAKHMLQEYFMLLYSDNFVQFNLTKLSIFHEKKGKLLSFIVQTKHTGNIKLDSNEIVEIYDKSRSKEQLDFVELGYMIASKDIFKYFDGIDISFSDVIARLVSDQQVAGMLIKDVYHSISDPDRLKLTEQYLAHKKILLIDRDGVINKKAPKGEYIDSWKRFEFIPENLYGMKMLSNSGHSFVIISNQAGIGRKMVTEETINSINEKMINALKDEGINILSVYICPHHWEDNCFCRKPNPGLFFRASEDFLIRLDKTFFIGDDPRDCQAACNAGCRSLYIGNMSDLVNLSSGEQPCGVFDNLKQAVSFLEKP